MSIYGPDNATARGGIREDLYAYVDSKVMTDTATKGYVDSNRYVTVWASAKGRLVDDQYQFGFGGGSVRNVKNNGYTMLCDGVIEKVGLVGGSTNTDTFIHLTINGVDSFSFGKLIAQRSSVVWEVKPVKALREGDVINFFSKVTPGVISDAKITTVNLLIRLTM